MHCFIAGAMAVGKKPAAAPVKGKKKQAAFVIDCSKPVEDKIMKIGEFEKFLVDKIKVDNKTGVFLGCCCHCRGSSCFHNHSKALYGRTDACCSTYGCWTTDGNVAAMQVCLATLCQ